MVTGFALLGQSGLFSATSLAFGALCTLTLDSRRCDANLGDVRKSLYFSDAGKPITVFCRKFHDIGFSPGRRCLPFSLICGWIVCQSIDSPLSA